MDPSKIADQQLVVALECDRHDLYAEMSQRALVSIAASLREIAALMQSKADNERSAD